MIDVAIEAAKAGGQLAKNYFKSSPTYKLKEDKSPVTEADIQTEKLIRKILSEKFPDHGFIGEELKPENPNAKYQWVIDPIDGTRDYVRQIPYWAVYVALLEEEKPIIGIAYMPEVDVLISAQKDKGTYLNAKKVSVSKTEKMDEAYVAFGTIKRWISNNRVDQLINVCREGLAGRSYGNLSLKLFLEKKFDIIIEADGGLHDFAAPSIIVEEAGGKFTDFSGKFSLTSKNAVITNGLLHDQVISLLNEQN